MGQQAMNKSEIDAITPEDSKDSIRHAKPGSPLNPEVLPPGMPIEIWQEFVGLRDLALGLKPKWRRPFKIPKHIGKCND
jgi:hypothetical protein